MSTETKFKHMKRRSLVLLGRRYNSRKRMLYAERSSKFMKENRYWEKDLQERIEAGRTPQARINRGKAQKKKYEKYPHLRELFAKNMSERVTEYWKDPNHRKVLACLREEAKYITPEGHIGFTPVMCERKPKVKTGVVVSAEITE